MSGHKKPVQTLYEQEPYAEDQIEEMSAKWTKRTKGSKTRWPSEGTFKKKRMQRIKNPY